MHKKTSANHGSISAFQKSAVCLAQFACPQKTNGGNACMQSIKDVEKSSYVTTLGKWKIATGNQALRLS